MKVAIVHDWLVSFGGAERVLLELLKKFPDADVFTLIDFLPEDDRAFLKGHKIHTSFLQRLPFAKTRYRNYLPLMPFAIEQFKLADYQLIISSSHAVAKGVKTSAESSHLCLCYSPMRYAWDMRDQYLRDAGLDKGIKGFLAKWILSRIRNWDYRNTKRVNHFIAISDFIAQRIQLAYNRESEIVYPPVNLEFFNLHEQKENFYITSSRMVPYKKVDVIAEAFKTMPDKQLIVIGDGPDFAKVQKISEGASNIKILGYQRAEVLKDYLQRAKAFVFAAEEDFGIAPLEAQACGTAVIAYNKGGAMETIIANKTGIFFEAQTKNAIADAVRQFETLTFNPESCRENALRFSAENFHKGLDAAISKTLASHSQIPKSIKGTTP